MLKLADKNSHHQHDAVAARMPLYRQLARQLQASLDAPGRAPAQLPSERQLSASLAISRDTARRALALLCERGVLERRHGSGTYSTGQRHADDLLPQGARLWLTREAAPATAEETMALGLAPNAPVARLRGLRRSDGRRDGAWLALETFSLALHLLPQPQHCDGEPAQQLLAQGLGPLRGLQRLRAVNATAEQARLLGVGPGQALLQVTNHSYAAEGQILLLSQSLRLGEPGALRQELRR